MARGVTRRLTALEQRVQRIAPKQREPDQLMVNPRAYSEAMAILESGQLAKSQLREPVAEALPGSVAKVLRGLEPELDPLDVDRLAYLRDKSNTGESEDDW